MPIAQLCLAGITQTGTTTNVLGNYAQSVSCQSATPRYSAFRPVLMAALSPSVWSVTSWRSYGLMVWCRAGRRADQSPDVAPSICWWNMAQGSWFVSWTTRLVMKLLMETWRQEKSATSTNCSEISRQFVYFSSLNWTLWLLIFAAPVDVMRSVLNCLNIKITERRNNHAKSTI